MRREDTAYLDWVALRDQRERDSALVSYLFLGCVFALAALSAVL
jgi:hypothetical protein